MTQAEYVHPRIAERIEEFQGVGLDAVLTRLNRNCWEVRHATDRVEVFCRWTRRSDGKLSCRIGITVDGERRPNVSDVQAYARLVANPDDRHPDRRPGADPLPELAEGEPPPAQLASAASQLADQSKVASVRTGTDGGVWVTEVRSVDGVTFHITWDSRPGGVHLLSAVRAVDDEGRDALVHGEGVREALASLLDTSFPEAGSAAPGSCKTGSSTVGNKANSVTARRASVFRV